MTLDEIKKAVDDGKTVHWSNANYKVIKSSNGTLLVNSRSNNHTIGLCGLKGTKYENVSNHSLNDFYIA